MVGLPARRIPAEAAAVLTCRVDPARVQDAAWPIFREMTLATFITDGAARTLKMWCCGHAAASGPPAREWQLDTFF